MPLPFAAASRIPFILQKAFLFARVTLSLTRCLSFASLCAGVVAEGSISDG